MQTTVGKALGDSCAENNSLAHLLMSTRANQLFVTVSSMVTSFLNGPQSGKTSTTNLGFQEKRNDKLSKHSSRHHVGRLHASRHHARRLTRSCPHNAASRWDHLVHRGRRRSCGAFPAFLCTSGTISHARERASQKGVMPSISPCPPQ